MIYLYLAQVMDDDKHREVEKAQLINEVGRSLKDQARNPLTKLVCRLGLIKNC